MSQRLTPLDATFLFVEGPHVHMETAGLSIYDPAGRSPARIELAEVRRLVACRIHLVPRFRQKVLSVPFSAARPRGWHEGGSRC